MQFDERPLYKYILGGESMKKRVVVPVAVAIVVGGVVAVAARKFLKRAKKQNSVPVTSILGEKKLTETQRVLQSRDEMWKD